MHMSFTSKQIKAQCLVLYLLFVYTINSSCISLTKSFKKNPPLVIEINTAEHLGKFTECGISKGMVNIVYSYLDIISEFLLSITNRSFYCLFNHQLDWIKFYYYTTVDCRQTKSSRHSSDKQLLRKILSLPLKKHEYIYFPQAPVNCERYLSHTSLENKFTDHAPLEYRWHHIPSAPSFPLDTIEPCPFSDNPKRHCFCYNFLQERLIICSKMLKNNLHYIGHHKHFIIQNIRMPIVYVFEHVHNSHDELIFFLHNCSFQRCDIFYPLLFDKSSQNNEGKMGSVYFFLTNRAGDKCCILMEVTAPQRLYIIGILSKRNPEQRYRLKNLFYLPSISFIKE